MNTNIMSTFNFFFLFNRLNLLPQKVLFKSDVTSWQPIDVPQQL